MRSSSSRLVDDSLTSSSSSQGSGGSSDGPFRFPDAPDDSQDPTDGVALQFVAYELTMEFLEEHTSI